MPLVIALALGATYLPDQEGRADREGDLPVGVEVNVVVGQVEVSPAGQPLPQKLTLLRRRTMEGSAAEQAAVEAD